jgi:polygalacturonase
VAAWALVGCLNAFAEPCAITPSSGPTVNVRDKGAKGDGRTDDTAALQRAIDEVGGKDGTVLVPDGVYMLDATEPKRVLLKSRLTLKLSAGATLKVIPNAEKLYQLLTISNVSHVTVLGGTLEGDRNEHLGAGGEWGMGIWITNGAKQVTVSGTTSKNMWGDGFYVDSASDVALCGVTADHNRRQGLSIIDADGVFVTDSVFKNTRGTRPSAGIDLEDHPLQVPR